MQIFDHVIKLVLSYLWEYKDQSLLFRDHHIGMQIAHTAKA